MERILPPPLQFLSPLKSSEDGSFSGVTSPVITEQLSEEVKARIISHAQHCLGKRLDVEEELKVLEGVLRMEQAIRDVQGKHIQKLEDMDGRQYKKCLDAEVHRVMHNIYIGTDRYLAELLASCRSEGYPRGFEPTIIVSVCEWGATSEEELAQLERSGITYMCIPIKDNAGSFDTLREQLPTIMGGIYSSFISVEITKCTVSEAIKLVKSVRPQVSSPSKIKSPNLMWCAREYYHGNRGGVCK